MNRQASWAFLAAVSRAADCQLSRTVQRVNRVDDQVQVIAHRGASGTTPESTGLAIDRAISLGADAIEIDVQLTADRHLVVQHDCTLDRTTDAGSVFGQPNLRICDLTLEQLRELDISTWFDPDLPTQRVLTLDEVVAHVDGRAGLLVEVSPCAQYATTELPDQIAHALNQLPNKIGLTVQSFRLEHCQRMRELAPDVRVAWLVDDCDAFTKTFADTSRITAILDAVSLEMSLADEARVRQLQRWGLGVYAWTPNDPEEMVSLIDIGVDGLITDHPDRAVAAASRPQLDVGGCGLARQGGRHH